MADRAHSPLTFDIERAGNEVVVRCHGKLVAGVNEVLYATVRPMIPDTRRIVLDLTDVTHMDSMGLGSVVRLYVSAKSAGCDLELVNFGERIRKMLSTTHLLSILASIGQQGIAIF
jgi:anti-sigma B factor antagonist